MPEMRIWSVSLIKSYLKWCIHLSRSLYLYLNKNVIFFNYTIRYLFFQTLQSLTSILRENRKRSYILLNTIYTYLRLGRESWIWYRNMPLRPRSYRCNTASCGLFCPWISGIRYRRGTRSGQPGKSWDESFLIDHHCLGTNRSMLC